MFDGVKNLEVLHAVAPLAADGSRGAKLAGEFPATKSFWGYS